MGHSKSKFAKVKQEINKEKCAAGTTNDLIPEIKFGRDRPRQTLT